MYTTRKPHPIVGELASSLMKGNTLPVLLKFYLGVGPSNGYNKARAPYYKYRPFPDCRYWVIIYF